ncbi:XAC2610-related protein [Lysobacter koreensis]|uniref:XAC2610-related protein n=1 Tax=Lysobacter koreensis TaxID=266122 RepID=A0ABW2YP73_9GAMM
MTSGSNQHSNGINLVSWMLIGALTLLVAGPALAPPDHAPDLLPTPAAVEFAVWTRRYTGTIGTHPVQVNYLQRQGDHMSGTYCYDTCKSGGAVLQLHGRLRDGAAELAESHEVNDGRVTGRWHLRFHANGAHGFWRSPEDKRTLKVTLQASMGAGNAFPYELAVVADALPKSEGDCDKPPRVTAIRIYQDRKLIQQLDTNSEGTCSLFTPEIVDMNFDGWLDISIALSLPAGPNVPQQSWLFDPKRRRFFDAPQSLQEIPSPQLDPEHKIVHSFWRAGAGSHGIDTYRWKDGELIQVDRRESYVMPVRKGGRFSTVYVMPEYRDGRISSAPMLTLREGRLRLEPGDAPEEFDDELEYLDPRTRVEVWQGSQTGAGPHLTHSHGVDWQQVSTAQGMRWCPIVPYFDLDTARIGHQLMGTRNGDLCSTERP